jgi:hypothetical protein
MTATTTPATKTATNKATTVRAIQIARRILKENADRSSTFHGVLNADDVAALEKLIEVAAKVATGVTGGKRRA